MNLDHLKLPTPEERRTLQPLRQKFDQEFKTRLDKKIEKVKTADKKAIDTAAFIWAKYKGRCHRCGIKVIKSFSRERNRGEIHHRKTKGAHPELKDQLSNLVLLCAKCHDQAQTGKVTVPRR